MDPSCEAGPGCQAQARAQASARLECEVEVLELGLDAGGVSADTAFLTRVAALEARGHSMLAQHAEYAALMDGQIDATVVLERAGFRVVLDEFEQLVDTDFWAEPRTPCPECAWQTMIEGSAIVERVANEAFPLLTAQIAFATALRDGFLEAP
jgi:hypothetical protein